jgi:predicted HicB family RNase H-like nuclease
MTKYIQLKITEEQHKQIKLKATEAGKSIKDYILEHVKLYESKSEFDSKACKLNI